MSAVRQVCKLAVIYSRSGYVYLSCFWMTCVRQHFVLCTDQGAGYWEYRQRGARLTARSLQLRYDLLCESTLILLFSVKESPWAIGRMPSLQGGRVWSVCHIGWIFAAQFPPNLYVKPQKYIKLVGTLFQLKFIQTSHAATKWQEQKANEWLLKKVKHLQPEEIEIKADQILDKDVRQLLLLIR